MTLAVSRHRRTGRARWIAVVVAVALIAVAGTVAYAVRSSFGCGEPAVTLNVAASPDHYPVVRDLAETWNGDEHRVDSRCAQIAVQAMPSSFAASTLSPEWDEERDGARPDVWIPDSSVWLTVAAARPDAAQLLPTEPPPSLASSPVVLAMQQPMAEALGWPERELGWSELLGAFAQGQTWEQFGHPEWGPLRLGLSDPTRSTAGLGGIMTVLDLDSDSALSDQELLGGIAFSQLITASEEDPSRLLQPYAEAGAEPAQLPAGFTVLERDLAVHAADSPAVPLVPVYVREGTLYADYPYTVLRASWVDADRQDLAGQFLAYLTGSAGREAYSAAGFRGAGHEAAGAPLLATDRGFAAEVASPPRQPTPQGVAELLAMWPALFRPANVLLLLDVSGSMNDEVPGTDQSRLSLLQSAATQGLGLLNNQTFVGLWEFSTELTPDTPYRVLVPVGPSNEEVGGVNRRQALLGAIQGLRADGGTGLYDTVHDAYLTMQEAWQADASNLVVVITDGKDEFHDGRSLPQLLDELGEAVQPDRPLPIVAMAVGPEADAAALQQITDVTGGRTVIARDEQAALQQVVLAFAGRLA
jgi:Ca-activated chloride channel homolog